MSKFSDNPDRKRFIKVEGFDNWQCMDYKTFYMTIRIQNHISDELEGRDPSKYALSMSSADIFYDIDTLELAIKKGYSRADFLYKMRMECKPGKFKEA